MQEAGLVSWVGPGLRGRGVKLLGGVTEQVREGLACGVLGEPWAGLRGGQDGRPQIRVCITICPSSGYLRMKGHCSALPGTEGENQGWGEWGRPRGAGSGAVWGAGGGLVTLYSGRPRKNK